jgi:RND family efflux transporter MFP subunit
MKSPVLRVVFLSAAVISVFACGGDAPSQQVATPASIAAELVTAEATSSRGELEVRGRVVALRTSTISSRVMAMVVARRVQVGDVVAKGAVLLEIDPAVAAGSVDQAEGALAQALAARELAARQVERFEQLAAQAAASALELDLAKTDLARAEGAVQQARGAVAAARAVAADSRITAPFAGAVVELWVDRGDLAAPGRPLVTLAADGPRRVEVALPESLAAELAPGAHLELEVDGIAGRLGGPIVELAPTADLGTFTRRAQIQLDRADLAPGRSARVFVPGAARESIVVPLEAVVHRGGLDFVVVRGADGVAESRPVRLGAKAGDTVQILAGLVGGEQLAVGLRTLPAPGTRIEGSR